MAEYIEREAALEALCKVSVPTFSLTGEPILDVDYVPAINAIPAADVVPVVRCGECRFWNRDRISVEGLARCNTVETGIRYRTKNDFCSRGMRMDGDGNVS